jgi:hypothetical protein
MASTGQAGWQAPQSMQSSGLMYSIWSGPSSKWMQSTGHASTQDWSCVPMQGDVMTKVMRSALPEGVATGRSAALRS